MGFLKRLIKILSVVLLPLFLAGCAKSLMKINTQKDESPVRMFGETGSRNFFVPVTLDSTLNLLWENTAHGSFNNSSFIFYDSTIFVHDLGGRIHAFNMYTGKQTGVLKYKGAVYSTPIIFNFNIAVALVLNNENMTELIFYDFFNGKELKVVELDGIVTSQMIAVDDDLIVITENGTVRRFDSRGNEVWKLKHKSFIHCNPAYINGKIYIGTNDGMLLCIDYDSGSVIFKKKIGAAFNSGITIKNNTAFLGDDDGIIYAVDINSGSLLWKNNTGARILMNAACDDENVYIGNLAGSLYSFNASTGQINWSTEINAAVFNSSPLVTENVIVISNLFQSVLFINKSTGQIIDKLEFETRVKMSPALRDGILFIGYDQGRIRAYEISN